MTVPALTRSLLRTPLVTAASVVALALALGATTLVYSVVDGVLLRSLPYRDPDRLVVIWETKVDRGRFENVASPANFLHWRDATRTMTDLAAVTMALSATLGEPGLPEEVPIQLVSGRLFEILGVDAALGRTFTPDEDRPGTDVVLISHRLWQRRFGSDPKIIGRRVRVNGEADTVVGVMPAGFSVLDPTVDLWQPIGFDERARTPRGRFLTVLGRLGDGVALPQAQAEMTQIVAGLTRKFPAFNAGWGARVVPLHSQLTGKVRSALLMLLGAVALVLLIACVNVANLLLARGVSRRREIAVRASLGASRLRTVGALLAESLVIAIGGAVLGYGLAWAGLRALQARAADTNAIPRLDTVTLDWRIAAVALAAAVAAAVIAGLLPAIEATRIDLTQALRDGNRGATSGRASRVRRALVVAEIALAVVLLAGSGLLIRSLVRLLHENPGFNPAGVLTARVSLSGDHYEENTARTQLYERLVERLDSLPGVTTAGAVSFLPSAGIGAGTSFVVVGRAAPPAGQEPVADIRIVTGDYFGALGIPLRRGRSFERTDSAPDKSAILVNEALVRAVFSGEEPLGRELKIGWFGEGPDRIAGVVGDVRHDSLETPARPTIYFHHPRSATRVMHLVVRTAGDPGALAGPLTREVRRLDPSLPVSALQTMDEVVADGVATRRLVMQMLTIFAGVALVLAGLGIFAVMAYSVAERRPELAIRMALGADASRVLRLVMRHSAMTTGTGLIVGGVGAFALTRLMSGLLYGVEPGDPVALAGAVAALAVVSLIASWVPGRAAASVEPLQALHSD